MTKKTEVKEKGTALGNLYQKITDAEKRNMGRRPDFILAHPEAWASIAIENSAAIRWASSDDPTRVFGIRVYESSDLEKNQIIVGYGW